MSPPVPSASALPSRTLHPGPCASLTPASRTLGLASLPRDLHPAPGSASAPGTPKPLAHTFSAHAPARTREPRGGVTGLAAAPPPSWRAAWPEFPAWWRRLSSLVRRQLQPLRAHGPRNLTGSRARVAQFPPSTADRPDWVTTDRFKSLAPVSQHLGQCPEPSQAEATHRRTWRIARGSECSSTGALHAK